MSSIVNLMYFEYEDTFYYVDAKNVEAPYRTDFVEFIEDVIDGANIPNPGKNFGFEIDSGGAVQQVDVGEVGDPIGFFTRESGEGALPFHQGMRLENISAYHVLTDFDDATVYNFTLEVQTTTYSFSDTGANLRTYQDVINLIEANTPATQVYFSTTMTSTPKINFSSHIPGQQPMDNGNGGQTGILVQSRISITQWANTVITGHTIITSAHGIFATVDFQLPDPTPAQILTRVPSNDDTVFAFSVGSAKNLSVRGFQAQTYQGLIDTINLFDGISATYSMSGSNKNTMYLYVAVPKSPKISDVTLNEASSQELIDTLGVEEAANIIRQYALLRGKLASFSGSGNSIQIESFVGLTQNSSILHILRNSVVGGYTMLTVLQGSKRSNGSYWTEIVPIENNRRSTNDVSSDIPEQKDVLDAIDADTTLSPEDKRKTSLNLGKIISIGGALLGGIASAKSSITQAAIGKIASLFGGYATPTNPASPEDVDPIQNEIIDTGYADGALDVNGNVIDESLLTPAQKSKLVPKARTTID